MSNLVPRCDISIRSATLADLPFMDRMQKANGKALGYFPTKQFEGYIETGGVLIAEEGGSRQYAAGRENDALPTACCPLPSPIGYIISRDRYLKRDELGVVYQLCVTPGTQRRLVGASLVREVFARSAYGCRLYCCWCAQDLEANHFWESLGFVPIAFRAGSLRRGSGQAKSRVHIFWQRRIGQGDVATPYWYPFQTNSGAIREDRLVFPIPPGVHWKDVQAMRLPEKSGTGLQPVIQGHGLKTRATKKRQKSKTASGPGPGQVGIVVGGRIKYINRPGYVAPVETTALAAPVSPKKARPKAAPVKIDPKYLSAAREFRDRYLEQLNGEQFNSGSVLAGAAQKYDVARALPVPGSVERPKLLDAA